MKNISILLFGLILLICSNTAFSTNRSDQAIESTVLQSGTKNLNVSSSPALYPLATNWVNDFNKSNPSVQLVLNQLNNSKLQLLDHLSLVTDDQMAGMNPANWKMIVGRDVIVPIVNKENPILGLLDKNGVSADKFQLLLNQEFQSNWATLVPGSQDAPVSIYMSNDAEIKSALNEFTKSTIKINKERLLLSPAEVIAAVQKDRFAIGFCKLNDLKRDMITTGSENFRLLPIDKNGNGRLDNFENIYGSLVEFTHGVWIGKYPSTLSNNIYASAAVKPNDENELAFLTWILNDGQRVLNSNGYCDLTSSEKQSNIASLINPATGGNTGSGLPSSPQSWPVFLTVFGLITLFVILFIYSRQRTATTTPGQSIHIAPLLIENSIDVPKGLFFDKTHTWAFMEQDGNVRIGIDDFLQHVTGKLTRIKMKEEGESVRKGETIMTIIKEGKQLNIYSPISGTIVAQNVSLLTDTGMINSSPFFKGWVYQIEPKNWLREVQFMLMGERYAEWLKDEFVRLKDFITASVKSNNLVYAHVVLQDGGELTDNVLADMEPRVWEDFQNQFIDTSR